MMYANNLSPSAMFSHRKNHTYSITRLFTPNQKSTLNHVFALQSCMTLRTSISFHRNPHPQGLRMAHYRLECNGNLS